MANNCCNGAANRIRALVPCIIDSCQQCLEITEQLSVPIPASEIRNAAIPCAVLPARENLPCSVCGDVIIEEVGCIANNCEKATTVLVKIPVNFCHCSGCAMEPFYQACITEMKTFKLRYCDFSEFELLNCEVQAVHCAITGITDDRYDVTVGVLMKVHVGQTVTKEVYLTTSSPLPVRNCGNNNCI